MYKINLQNDQTTLCGIRKRTKWTVKSWIDKKTTSTLSYFRRNELMIDKQTQNKKKTTFSYLVNVLVHGYGIYGARVKFLRHFVKGG